MVPVTISLIGNLRGPRLLLSQIFQELHTRGLFAKGFSGGSSSFGVGGSGVGSCFGVGGIGGFTGVEGIRPGVGTDHRPQYVFQGSQFRPRASAPRPPMVFPPNFPVDIFITKDLFKKGMQVIHTEMKKHETFPQNMYNKLYIEL